MDGMHSRVRGYKTLTLWTYHPGMNKVIALAIMECQNKNTQMIKHFLQTFKKCLQDYTGIDDYKFDLYGIMCDEGGANMNAILLVTETHVSMHILHNLLVVPIVVTCSTVCASQYFTHLEHPNILQQTNKHLVQNQPLVIPMPMAFQKLC